MGLNQTEQMAAFIAIFAKIGGTSVTCQELQTLAAEYACLPRQTQLPALIYLATQILANGGGGTGGAPDYINYPGPPTAIPPVLQHIVVDSNGQQWQYWGGQWN